MMEILTALGYEQLALYIVTAVGAASLISKAITMVTRVTPNTVDDEYANKIGKAIGYVQVILDRLALNPKADDARK